jgi:predicted transcriptional regulator
MAQARAISRSTSLSDAVETRVKAIAERENRSVSNVMENAIRVFTLLPKDLRDMLVEASSDEAEASARFKEISRVVLFNAARERFLNASKNLAATGAVDLEMLADDEAVIKPRF